MREWKVMRFWRPACSLWWSKFWEGVLSELGDAGMGRVFKESPSDVKEVVSGDVQVVELAVADDEQIQKLVTPVSINI